MKEDPIPVGARLTDDRLPGCTARFGARPRGRAPMPSSLALGLRPSDSTEVARPEPGHWTRLELHQHLQRRLFGKRSASGRRRQSGSGGQATDLAEAIHRLVLWVGGLSTVGAISTLQRGPPFHTGRRRCLAATTITAWGGEVHMNDTDKPTPIASLPDNWSVFNGHEVLPWDMSRAETAATLRRARRLRVRGQAAIGIEALGRYSLSTFNTLILDTRRR